MMHLIFNKSCYWYLIFFHRHFIHRHSWILSQYSSSTSFHIPSPLYSTPTYISLTSTSFSYRLLYPPSQSPRSSPFTRTLNVAKISLFRDPIGTESKTVSRDTKHSFRSLLSVLCEPYQHIIQGTGELRTRRMEYWEGWCRGYNYAWTGNVRKEI